LPKTRRRASPTRPKQPQKGAASARICLRPQAWPSEPPSSTGMSREPARRALTRSTRSRVVSSVPASAPPARWRSSLLLRSGQVKSDRCSDPAGAAVTRKRPLRWRIHCRLGGSSNRSRVTLGEERGVVAKGNRVLPAYETHPRRLRAGAHRQVCERRLRAAKR
jgi:hypothetical protein